MNRYRFLAVEDSTGNKMGGIVEAVNVSGAIRLIKDHDLHPGKVEVVTTPDENLFPDAAGQQTRGNNRFLHVAPVKNPDGTLNTSLLSWLGASDEEALDWIHAKTSLLSLLGAWAVVIVYVAAFLFAVGLALYVPYWIVQDIKDGHLYTGSGTPNSPRTGGGVRIGSYSSPLLFWFEISLRTVGAVAIWAWGIWFLRPIFFSAVHRWYTKGHS